MSAPTTRARATVPSGRDLTLDLTRVSCVLLVVVIHLLMVSVGVGSDGALIARPPDESPLASAPWFPYATWVGQVMPLFFVVGGFASLTAWRSLGRRGGTAADFVRARVLRLARPALPLYAVFAVVLGIAYLARLDPPIVDLAAQGAGSPLWFLAAYTLCQALVPVMAGWHERAPRATLAVLLAGVIAVDAARYTTGVTELGLVNLSFVWLLVQQLGFGYADGWFARLPRAGAVLIAVAAYGSLVPLTSWGPYSVDMLDNLNPPTLPLVVLAVAQACVLRLARPALARVMETTAARAVVFTVGSRLMTVYLWHLPVILALSGLSLLVPGAAPDPGSAAWWWSRPLLLVATLVALAGVARLVGRVEAARDAAPSPSAPVVAVAAALAFLPSFLVLQFFLDLGLALVGTVLLTGVLVLLRSGRSRAA